METPNERELDFVHTHLFPKLRWMEKLKNFVCYHTEVRQRDATVFDVLFQWISTELQFKNLERFWYGTGKNMNIEVPATIRSWQFAHKMPSYSLEQFTELVEIGGIKMKNVPCLPKLRLVEGSFSSYQVKNHLFMILIPVKESLPIKWFTGFIQIPETTTGATTFVHPSIKEMEVSAV